MKAVCLIRPALIYRRQCFITGLKAAGFKVVDSLPAPTPKDVLVIWNRYYRWDTTAKLYEKTGARVIVCENGYMGKAWMDDTWIAMSIGHHAGAGVWREGAADRWDDLRVKMAPFRTDGKELILFQQRGLGEPGIAAPANWAETKQRELGGRIRQHPGNTPPRIPLEKDLEKAFAAATWNSGAALKALLMGIPMWYDFPQWIGLKAATPLKFLGTPFARTLRDVQRDEAKRLSMFRRLIWAQWRLSEIESGAAFRYLLGLDVAAQTDSGNGGDVAMCEAGTAPARAGAV